MNRRNASYLVAFFCALSPLGCDDENYTPPATVQLVITRDSSTTTLVDRCNYVPVLLGSKVKARYVVEGDLKATLTITADVVTVGFDGAADDFEVSVAKVADGAQGDPAPPPGYTVDLIPACTPDGT